MDNEYSYDYESDEEPYEYEIFKKLDDDEDTQDLTRVIKEVNNERKNDEN